MLELVGALIIGLLTWQGVRLLVARGVALGWWHKRREERECSAKWRPFFEDDQSGIRRERSRQPKGSEAERRHPAEATCAGCGAL
jgi:hypothetical protein